MISPKPNTNNYARFKKLAQSNVYLIEFPLLSVGDFFRSASIITTDGFVPFTNLENCSVTDGKTCDRASAPSYANLYFRDFGTYGDFGMPQGSEITKLTIKVAGRISNPIYVGLSTDILFQFNCQFPSDLWTLYNLGDQTINTIIFNTDAGYPFLSAGCLLPYHFENNNRYI